MANGATVVVGHTGLREGWRLLCRHHGLAPLQPPVSALRVYEAFYPWCALTPDHHPRGRVPCVACVRLVIQWRSDLSGNLIKEITEGTFQGLTLEAYKTDWQTYAYPTL